MLKRRSFLSAIALGTLATVSAFAAPITVSNATFTNANNAGHVGGNWATPVSNQWIGSAAGAWRGSTSGNLGWSDAPLMTISKTGGYDGKGVAQISGIANTSIFGSPADNGAFFSQTLNGVFQANTRYTLTTDIYTGSLLSTTALANAGVGIGLASVPNGVGTGSLVASTTANSTVSLSALSHNWYQLSLTYQTGATAPAGNIALDLFNTPSGLTTSKLFSSISFSNVTLDAVASTPEPASIGITGLILIVGAVAGFRKRRPNVVRC